MVLLCDIIICPLSSLFFSSLSFLFPSSYPSISSFQTIADFLCEVEKLFSLPANPRFLIQYWTAMAFAQPHNGSHHAKMSHFRAALSVTRQDSLRSHPTF